MDRIRVGNVREALGRAPTSSEYTFDSTATSRRRTKKKGMKPADWMLGEERERERGDARSLPCNKCRAAYVLSLNSSLIPMIVT